MRRYLCAVMFRTRPVLARDKVGVTTSVLLCKHPAVKNYDLSSVRHLMSGAAPLSSELMAQLKQLLPETWIGQAYGTCSHPAAHNT